MIIMDNAFSQNQLNLMYVCAKMSTKGSFVILVTILRDSQLITLVIVYQHHV